MSPATSRISSIQTQSLYCVPDRVRVTPVQLSREGHLKARRPEFLVPGGPETYFPYSPNSWINTTVTCITVLVATGTLSGLRTYLPIDDKSQVPLPPPPEALPQLAINILPLGPKVIIQPWQHTPTVNLSPLLSQYQKSGLLEQQKPLLFVRDTEVSWRSHLCPFRSTEEVAATSVLQTFSKDTRSMNKHRITTLPIAQCYSKETDSQMMKIHEVFEIKK